MTHQQKGYKRPEVTGSKNGKFTHGHAGNIHSPTYRSWRMMRARCLYPSHRNYKDYGARGITFCDRWNSFENFLADMGKRPEGMNLDRIDTNGNYKPSNCRWTDEKTQQRNRTNNLYVMVNGTSRLLIEWCEENDVKYSSVISRVRRGWTLEEAISKPIKKGNYAKRKRQG